MSGKSRLHEPRRSNFNLRKQRVKKSLGKQERPQRRLGMYLAPDKEVPPDTAGHHGQDEQDAQGGVKVFLQWKVGWTARLSRLCMA